MTCSRTRLTSTLTTSKTSLPVLRRRFAVLARQHQHSSADSVTRAEKDPMNAHNPEVDPHDVSAAIASQADRVRAAAEAGTVPPASADQLAQLLDTIAAELNTAPTGPPENTLNNADGTAEPPS